MRHSNTPKVGTLPLAGDEELLTALGHRLANARLQLNWTQAHLATEAGVSRATVQRMEQGESTQLTNLLRILRALDLLRNLESLVPAIPISPLEMWRSDRSLRQRASSKGTQEARAPWQWGEDQ